VIVMPFLDLEIREQLARYIAGDISLGAFREWFSPRAWNIDQRADASTARVVHEIDLMLAEFDHGDWTEEEVKRLLNPLVIENTSIYFHAAPWVQVSTSSVLGSQPTDSTKYFGVRPLFQSPQIQLSQPTVTEQAR
jgi:hypothetical protein